MKALAIHTSDDGSQLAVTFECETWEQAQETAEKHGLALQGAASKDHDDD